MFEALHTIDKAFRTAVSNNPQKIAVFFHEKDEYRALSYRDLFRDVNAFTTIFKKYAIAKNDHVAFIMHNSLSWIEAFLACTHIGAVIIPLNPELEQKELRFLLSSCEPKIIFTDEKSASPVRAIAQELSLKTLVLDSKDIKKQKEQIEKYGNGETIHQGSDVACIIYTSGTTASPKGVQLTHENFLANIISLQKLRFIVPEDRIICFLPLHHAYPLMATFLLPLLTGASLSLSASLDQKEIMRCIQQTNATILVGVPRLFVLLKEKIEKGIRELPFSTQRLLAAALAIASWLRKGIHINCAPFILAEVHKQFGKKLRCLISGGAKLDEGVARQFHAWGFTLLEGYGLTETAPVISFNTPAKYKIGSAGQPIPGVSVQIHQPDESGCGEIIVQGNNVTIGYYKDRALTAQRIKNNWFFTGDIGRLDRQGFLYVYQRIDDTIVLSTGKKINPAEIEAHYEQSPFIKEVCVFALGDARAAATTLAAIVRPDYEQLHAQKIYQIKDKMRWEIEHLSIHLASHKHITTYTIATEPFARTELGKLKRYLVQQAYQKQSRDTTSPLLSQEEKTLLADPLCKKAYDFLCQEAKKEVHLSDNLELDLGFDSLQQITLLAEFENMAGTIGFKEEDFASFLTVKDVLLKLKSIAPDRLPGAQSETHALPATWAERLSQPIKDETKRAVALRQNVLQKTLNILFLSVFRFVFLLFFRVTVQGTHNLPRQGPMIICANHTSYLDGPLLFCFLPSPCILDTYFLGLKAYFDHFLIAWAKKLFRFISIDTNMEVAESLQLCTYVLKSGKNLCIFPEGRRSLTGALQPFKKGIGLLIEEANVTVIPVYINGAFQAWPAYRIFPAPHTITIRIGEPVRLQALSAKATTESIDNYANIMHNLSKHISLLERTFKK